MSTTDTFLRNLFNNPADDTTRLVYADWLDEQGDEGSKAQAEFLRVTVSLAGLGKKPRQKRKLLQRRLQELAAGLDTTWLAVVTRTRVENCAGKQAENWQARSPALFEFVCDRQWEEMRTTEDQTARFCDSCQQTVHYCDTLVEARRHTQEGHCVAVDLGVIRRPRDLRPELLMLGRMSPDFMRREQERLRPDPVSEERERRKQEAKDADSPGG